MILSKRFYQLISIVTSIIIVFVAVWFFTYKKQGAFLQNDREHPAISLTLVRDGRARCAIVCGSRDAYAGRRLQRWFAEEANVEVPVIDGEKLPPKDITVILLGSSGSDSLLSRLSATLEMSVDRKDLTDQGYRMRSVRHEGRNWLILAGGGRNGVIYAVSDLMNWRFIKDKGRVSLDPVDTTEIPKFKYRWFWNWDNRMEWGGGGKIATTMASVRGGSDYGKNADAFLIDTKRCVDYMADHKFNGMILWGFLRDVHGGVEAGKEISRYAKERGVRILPGVGTSGYGGIYYEGKHLYNADTWLAAHPELRAVDEQGHQYNALCPSKKENQEWLNDGVLWLFKTFDIGGVNLEMGDFLVCHCDKCKRARAAIHSDDPDYYKDMAISHKVTIETVHSEFPDAWLSYATYTGYTADMMKHPPAFLNMIPDYALCQWTLTSMAQHWPSGIKPMAKNNIGYLHWCNLSTHTEDDFYLWQVRNICTNAKRAGFEGLDTYGELDPERPNAELFYLAWEAFLWDPDMSIERFVDQRLGRLYGGKEAARKLLEILPLIKTAKERENPGNLARARTLAESARKISAVDGIPRWNRLIAYLDSMEPKDQVP